MEGYLVLNADALNAVQKWIAGFRINGNILPLTSARYGENCHSTF